MNLRKEPVKKKRGRPANTFVETFKGFLMSYFLQNQRIITSDEIYNAVEEFAKKFAKQGTIPCIVFDDNGGSFTGVNKRES